MKKNSSLRIKRDKIGQLINVRGEVQVSHTFCVCHVRTTKFTLIWLIKCQPKCVTYVWRKVIPFAFIIILDLFKIPTKTSVINTISPVIRDDYMHWPYCSDFQRFLFFSSYFSYRVSLSVHSLSGWYVCHYSTPVSAIRSHLSLGFPLHHITSVSGRCSRRANHISFAVVAAAVSGASLPLPPTLWHASLSASCVILVVAIGSLFLSPLSPPLVIVGWFWTPHRAWYCRPPFSPPLLPTFASSGLALSFFLRLRLRLLITKVLLSLLPPLVACYCRLPFSADWFDIASVLEDQGRRFKGFT